MPAHALRRPRPWTPHARWAAPHQAGLVNALLRRAQRDGVPLLVDGAGWPAWLAAAHPPRLAGACGGDLRCQRAGRADVAAGQPEPLASRCLPEPAARCGHRGRIRVRPGRCHPPGGTDAGARRCPDSMQAWCRCRMPPAQCVADALLHAPAPPGRRVLDACAAPGGKAAHLLERDPTPADACARHRSAPACAGCSDTFERLGVEVDARAADAAQPATWWDGTAVRRDPDRCTVQRDRHRAPPAGRAAASSRGRHRCPER